MEQGLWEPGDVVVWREVWRDQTWGVIPVRVVEDGQAATAVYLAERTEFAFPGWPWGRHPWEGKAWTGHGVLILYRPGDAFTIWLFWRGDERAFAGWYVNLQTPWTRDGRSFETADHELDLVVRPDESWYWKDEDKMDDWVRRGRFTDEDVAAFRREGERVLAEWPFPTGWEEWRADPSWEVPRLPDGWESP